jgi:phosphonate transport system substrate-binding protein
VRTDLVVFGYVGKGVSDATRAKFVDFTDRLGRAVTLEISIFEATSYDDLATAIVSGYVDLAWLPPMPFMALDLRSAIRPLVAHERADGFHSALIVAAGSRFRALTDLEGVRAAWVDRESASGFLLARIALARAGVDVRRAFSEERFFGSHEAVARAITRNVSDFGATYAGVDATGALTRAPWLTLDRAEAAGVRVLARIGNIPSDATVSRVSLPEETHRRLADALVAMSKKARHKPLLRKLFGIERFVRWQRSGYDEFRREVDAARSAGLLDGVGRLLTAEPT